MAEVANNSVFSQNDSSNTGALPGLSGTSPPSQIDNSIRALMGSTKREHDWRNFTVTSSGSANAYLLSYSVAPDGYYTGQRFAFKTNFAVTGAATVNVNGLGAKTIKKIVSGALTDLSSGDIASGDYVDLVYDGTYFVWVNKGTATPVSSASDSAQGIVELSTPAEVLTGTDTTRAITPDANAAIWEMGSDIASATTISIGEGGYFHVTGTTTITDIDFGTAKDGRKAILVFDGALTLTHNSTTLVCPTGASITTAAGDTCLVVQDSSDNIKVAWYQRADGTALTTSGGSIDFLGTFDTSSGGSQTLSGLDLTDGAILRVVFRAVSQASNNVNFLIGTSSGNAFNPTSDNWSSSATYSGVIDFYLSSGFYMSDIVNSSAVDVSERASGAPFSTSSTSVYVSPSVGNFDAGAIDVYLMK